MRAGIIHVQLTRSQINALTPLWSRLPAATASTLRRGLDRGESRLSAPFTGVHALASMVIEKNSSWNGEPQSKTLHELGRRLSRAVVDYGRHPAFKGAGAIGQHWDVVLPAWGDHWWPTVDADRVLLQPRVRTWKRQQYTEWIPTDPAGVSIIRQGAGVELMPNFDLIESLAVHHHTETPDVIKPRVRRRR